MNMSASKKHLTLIRHGDAQSPHMVKIDRDRALSGVGLKQVEIVGARLHEHFLDVDYVLCSNARRTRQTLEGLRRYISERAQLSFEDRLYGASVQFLLERIRRIEDRYQHVVVIGHNPTLQDFMTSVSEVSFNQDTALSPITPGSVLVLSAPIASWFQSDFHTFQVTQQFSP